MNLIVIFVYRSITLQISLYTRCIDVESQRNHFRRSNATRRGDDLNLKKIFLWFTKCVNNINFVYFSLHRLSIGFDLTHKFNSVCWEFWLCVSIFTSDKSSTSFSECLNTFSSHPTTFVDSSMMWESFCCQISRNSTISTAWMTD